MTIDGPSTRVYVCVWTVFTVSVSVDWMVGGPLPERGGMCVCVTAAAADVVDICFIIFAVSWYREFLVFVQFIDAVVVYFVSNIFRVTNHFSSFFSTIFALSTFSVCYRIILRFVCV